MEIHPRQRELHSRRRSLRTVRLVPVRTVPARINPQPIAVPVAPTPIEPISNWSGAALPGCHPARQQPRSSSPESTAQTQATVRGCETSGARRQARLGRDDEYQLLRCAYAMVRRWEREGVGQEIERELRAEAQVPISRMSSLFLVLLRSALPRLDGKRASKMALALAAADDQAVTAKRLAAFLWHNGGIEGAARQRAWAVRRASSR